MQQNPLGALFGSMLDGVGGGGGSDDGDDDDGGVVKQLETTQTTRRRRKPAEGAALSLLGASAAAAPAKHGGGEGGVGSGSSRIIVEPPESRRGAERCHNKPSVSTFGKPGCVERCCKQASDRCSRRRRLQRRRRLLEQFFGGAGHGDPMEGLMHMGVEEGARAARSGMNMGRGAGPFGGFGFPGGFGGFEAKGAGGTAMTMNFGGGHGNCMDETIESCHAVHCR